MSRLCQTDKQAWREADRQTDTQTCRRADGQTAAPRILIMQVNVIVHKQQVSTSSPSVRHIVNMNID